MHLLFLSNVSREARLEMQAPLFNPNPQDRTLYSPLTNGRFLSPGLSWFLWKPYELFGMLRHQRRRERTSLHTALSPRVLSAASPPLLPPSAKDHMPTFYFECLYFIYLKVETFLVNFKCLGVHGKQHREVITSELLPWKPNSHLFNYEFDECCFFFYKSNPEKKKSKKIQCLRKNLHEIYSTYYKS